MGLHVGAGARTTVRMRQRQENRIRRTMIGAAAAVTVPAVLIGGWQLAVNTWLDGGETTSAQTLQLGAAAVAPDTMSDGYVDPGIAPSVAASPGDTAPDVDTTTGAPQSASTSPSLSENGGPGTARPSSPATSAPGASTAGTTTTGQTAQGADTGHSSQPTQASEPTQTSATQTSQPTQTQTSATQTSQPGHTHATRSPTPTGTATSPPPTTATSPPPPSPSSPAPPPPSSPAPSPSPEASPAAAAPEPSTP